MARNRKSQSIAIRFGPALKAFLLCFLIGGSGIGYVWQKDEIYRLGHEQKKRELKLHELREQNRRLGEQLAVMRSPKVIEERIREFKLGLVPHEASQVWLLPKPSAKPLPSDEGRPYVARSELSQAGSGP